MSDVNSMKGKRAIVSPLPVTPLEFPDAFDVRALVGRPIANSTAAHLSARGGGAVRRELELRVLSAGSAGTAP